MKNEKIIYFVILFTLVALLGGGLVQAQESMTTQLQMVLEDAVNSPETVFPGALLYVSSPEIGTWSGAAGLSNIETSIAMKLDDKFRAGSTIKPMIAVIILQLVEEGKFSLDDPMTAVLPESVTSKFAYSDQITVRMLLNHTSGMADCIGPVMNEIIADLAKVWEADEWLDVAAAQEPYFAPGEDWMYSNTDYILLGLVIEQATGRSWRESLRERIIEKLNLENTLLPEPGDLSIPGNYAHGYMDLGAGLIDVTEVDPSMADAAGGSALITTTIDFARFLDAVLAGEFFQNTGTLEEMLTFVDVPEDNTPIIGLVGYGLGMMKSSFPGNIEMVGHSGDTAGFSAFAFHLPAEGITVSGVVNDMDPSGSLLRVLLPALEVLISDFESVLPELDPASSALQGLLDQQVQEQGILGMAMSVRLADGTVIGKASGYSDPSGEESWSVDTQSAVCSVTKTYTAVVIMQLVEEGKLSLDDTIDTWFPQQPDGDKITVRMLLSHTSGLANYFNWISAQNVMEMEGKWNKEWAPMDLVAEANKLGPVGEPGSSEAHYSNTNFFLLGLIVEEVTGNSWAQEVESRIIEPLELKDTTFLSKEGIFDIMVGGYTKTEDGYINLLEEPWYPHPSTVWSAGEIVTTVSDLMTFASALFDGKLVSRETLAVMAQPLATDVDSGILWGLGGGTLEMLPPGAFGMGGDIPGYHAFFIGFLDNKLIVTALVNTQEGDVITPSLSALQYISQSLSGASDESGAATEIQAPDYQKIIDEVLQDDRPGIALRVITPEFEVLETRGYVDWEKAIPLEKDHLFRIASCTKTFIATLTLMLHFEGGLDLDDSITMYLPESITSRIQYADQITIRQMLNHTSGIFNTGDNPEYWEAQYGDPTKEWTDTEVLEFALDHPANFEPGSGYAYSNTNYLLAGLILDQVLGHHHSADVRSRILEPLGLSSTFYEQKEPFDRGMLSHGYFDFDGDGIAEDYYGLRIETGRAEGGLVSTAGDLAAFITALATQRDFPNTEYREQFMQELLTIQPVASGEPGQVGTGLGIAEYDYGYGPGYGHSGGIPGYVSLMIYFPDHDVTFAMTWNGFDGGFADFGMVPALYEALIEGTFSALGIASTLADDASAGNVYEDPAGRFTMPLVGDWTPVETDGTYAKYAFSDLDLAMSLVSIEASDVEGDMPTAVQAIGVDPASLTETYRGSWDKWSLFYYDTASGEGVTVLGQVQDGIGYYVVATGDTALTSNAPDDVMKTIEGFALTGEVVLPSTVVEFESYVNDIVGLRPPALSIAIATTDDLIYAQGFGMADRPEDIQATSDTVYFWGSVTKTVTATAIMKLREQGLVDLEAPVSDYLDYVPAQHGITVWNLLTHSSGMPEPHDWLPSHLRLEGQPLPDADVMDRDYYAELTDLMFEPGSQSAYANPDFVTLGQIVAAVSGQSYLEYVREHILGPLGMVNTDFEYSTDSMVTQAAAPATSLSNREAMITIIDDARGLGDATSFFRESDENTAWMNHFIVGEAAGGGLMGPVTEMVRFAQMLANGGELDGQRILSAESVELLRQEQVSNSGEPLGFGMAWHIRDETEHPYIEHGGGGEGVDALLRVYYKDEFAIALQANSGGYSRQDVMDAAANVVLTMLGGGTPQEQPVPVSTPTAGSAANKYVDPQGRFSMPLVGDWTAVETDGTYGHVVSAEPPLNLYLVAVESDDLTLGAHAALRQVGIDPAGLTVTDAEDKFGPWDLTYYSLGEVKGVTTTTQARDGTVYVIIIAGDFVHTSTVADHVVRTVGGFALSGADVLPTTVEEFETYVGDVVGDVPPGLSMAIALGNDIIYAKGFGVADGPMGMAAEEDTVYQWGSVAKIVNAVAIMQLREQGLVDLAAPVADYLDYFPAEHGITVRHLLSHSAGLPDPPNHTEINIRLDGQPLADSDLIDRTHYKTFIGPSFEPGSSSAYSNVHYVTLGQVVAAASGQPYVEYVREHILTPLGMANTDFSYSETMITKAAAGAVPEAARDAIAAALDEVRGLGDGADYFRESDGHHAWMTRYNVLAAHGGLIGSATEMIRLAQMVLNDGELDGVRVLSPESVALMQEMQFSTDGDPLGYALGWEVYDTVDHYYIAHPGGDPGLQADLRLYPNEGFAIALMSNAGGYDYMGVVDAAANVVFSMLGSDAGGDEPVVAFTTPIVDVEGNEVPGSIAVIETVTLGGVKQTVTIRGADTTKPVLLFLHGGPGMPSSPWATWNNVHADLEEEFVFVHWDQRGAGKSYSEELTADDMHMDNFVSDTLELTNILRERFDQEKIFLWGHSWGSGLGFETIRVNSEPYHAFIASAVRPDWNSTQEMGYEKVLEIAHQANDTEAIQALESIQPFDPINPEHVGIRGQFLSRYLVGDFHTEGLEEAWLDYVFSDRSSEYPAAYIDQTLAGHGFSRQTIGLEVMTNGYDHATDFPVSTIPVYFIQGRYDYECPGELAEEYYNSLEAPVKSLTWFENSAHDVYYDEPDEFNQELIRIANGVLASVQTVPE